MTRNVGIVDKLIRVLLAIIILVLILKGVVAGAVAVILGILAVAFIFSGLSGFCPLYLPLKINTACKSNSEESTPEESGGEE